MHNLAAQAHAIAEAYQPPHIGRPSDIGNEDTVREFLQAIGDGNYVETACKLAGLSKQAVYEWLKRGQTGEEPYKRFGDAVEKAEARAEAHLVSLQRKAAEAGPQYWPAAATQLERRHPDRWGKRQDDSSAPKVVVHVGGNATDVKVMVVTSEVSPPTFAPISPEEDTRKSLETQAFAEPSSPIRAVMLTSAEPCQVEPAPPKLSQKRRKRAHGSPVGTRGEA